MTLAASAHYPVAFVVVFAVFVVLLIVLAVFVVRFAIKLDRARKAASAASKDKPRRPPA